MTLLQRSLVVAALALTGVVSNANENHEGWMTADVVAQLALSGDLMATQPTEEEKALTAFETNSMFEMKASRRAPRREATRRDVARREESRRVVTSPGHGSSTCTRSGPFTHCSGSGGSSTCTSNGPFTHCSGSGGSSTCTHSGPFTHCSGSGGSTTCTTNGPFTHCSGSGGSTTCTTNGPFTHCN